MNFLELTAVLGLDKKDYDAGLDEASGKANSFASSLGNVAKVAGGIAVAGITATATATIAGTKAWERLRYPQALLTSISYRITNTSGL